MTRRGEKLRRVQPSKGMNAVDQRLDHLAVCGVGPAAYGSQVLARSFPCRKPQWLSPRHISVSFDFVARDPKQCVMPKSFDVMNHQRNRLALFLDPGPLHQFQQGLFSPWSNLQAQVFFLQTCGFGAAFLVALLG
ncbi:hypothetical protein A210_16610 [Pseudomonas putida SJTE-1]|nr:hypothetical protein A210_16610 [Pseudomonas putida SJTE-1]